MIRIGSIVLRVEDLRRQTQFWSAAPHFVPREGDSDDFALLRPRGGAGPNLSPDRVHSTVADDVILADPEGKRFCVVDAS